MQAEAWSSLNRTSSIQYPVSRLRDIESTMNYLRLIRLPNVFTALADVWAGFFFCLAVGQSPNWFHLGMLMVASGCLYAGGIALNDVSDLEWDRIHRPERPLPSGAISKRNAVILVNVLLTIAIVSAIAVGKQSLIVSSALVGSIVFYNYMSKSFAPFAAAGMGSCRFFNLLLGATAFPGGWKVAWLPAAFLGVYIFFVTLISRMEDAEVKVLRLALMAAALILVALGTASLYQPDFLLRGFGILVWVPVLLGNRAIQALKEATPAAVGGVIGTSILCIILIDSALVMGTGHRMFGLICAAFIIPSLFLSRRFAMT